MKKQKESDSIINPEAEAILKKIKSARRTSDWEHCKMLELMQENICPICAEAGTIKTTKPMWYLPFSVLRKYTCFECGFILTNDRSYL